MYEDNQYYQPVKILTEVNYVDQLIDQTEVQEIQTLITEYPNDIDQLNCAQFIFNGIDKKRNAFKYEDEVRLIIHTKEDLNSHILKCICDPVELIEAITFDPRCEDSFFEPMKHIFHNYRRNGKLNSDCQIRRSDLYGKTTV